MDERSLSDDLDLEQQSRDEFTRDQIIDLRDPDRIVEEPEIVRPLTGEPRDYTGQSLPSRGKPIRFGKRGWMVVTATLVGLGLTGYLIFDALSSAPLSSLSAEVVNPGEVTLSFSQPGELSGVYVKPGQVISKGQVLAVETVPGLTEAQQAATSAVAADEAEIADLESLLSAAEQTANNSKNDAVQMAQEEVTAAQQELSMDQSTLAAAKANAATTVGAAANLLALDQADENTICSGIGSISGTPTAAQLACLGAQRQVAADELALANAKASAQSAIASDENAVSTDERILADAQAQASLGGVSQSSQIATLQEALAVAKSQLQRDQASVTANTETASSQTLKAPIAGKVVSVNGVPGEVVGQGGVADQSPSGSPVAVSPGFTLFPSTQTVSGNTLAQTPVVVLKGSAPAYLEVLVPENQIGEVHIGDKVKFVPNAAGMKTAIGTVEQIYPRPVVAAGIVSYEVQATIQSGLPEGYLTGITGKASIVSSIKK